MAPQRIGFIGLGMMGHGMAKNLVQKGFPLTILGNRNRKPVDRLVAMGAVEAKSPAEIARAADLVFICVTGSPEVESLIYREDGVLSGARQGLIVIDCSTAEPGSTAKIAVDLKGKGTTYVDAPLARTPKEAEEGRLNVMVGAEPEVFRAIEPVLQAFSENVFLVGPPGAGHTLKLVNNFLALGQAALIAEALVTAAKSGVDLKQFYKVVSAGGVNSGIFQLIVPKAIEGDYGGMLFGLANARKDMRYYTHMTEAATLTSFLGEAVHQSLVQAAAMGFDDRLVGSLVEAQEKINGVSVARRGSRD